MLRSADYDGDIFQTPRHRPYVTKEWIYVLIALGTIHSLLPTFGMLADTAVSVAALAIAIALFIIDRRVLAKAGYRPPHWIWFLFIPVYAWKRDTLTGRHHRVFHVSMAALLFSIVMLAYNELKVDKVGIADTACQTVTGVTKRNDGVNAPGCKEVTLLSESAPNHWDAIATMENGTNKRLKVEYDPKVNFVNTNVAGYTGYIK